eukprot:GEMP01053018.1.p1 GENE.GEMP01053018.1~~GEMP01053018.1.p1  ORF type:complete len:146 (-),score=0.16 GEMP01053018.1:994-1431(-)
MICFFMWLLLHENAKTNVMMRDQKYSAARTHLFAGNSCLQLYICRVGSHYFFSETKKATCPLPKCFFLFGGKYTREKKLGHHANYSNRYSDVIYRNQKCTIYLTSPHVSFFYSLCVTNKKQKSWTQNVLWGVFKTKNLYFLMTLG